jgi:hypothetical protein
MVRNERIHASGLEGRKASKERNVFWGRAGAGSGGTEAEPRVKQEEWRWWRMVLVAWWGKRKEEGLL